MSAENSVNDGEEYDPYDDRVVLHPTNNIEASLHILLPSFGAGLLAMPYAFSKSGWINGLISTPIVMLYTTYCIHRTLVIIYEICKENKIPALSYSKAIEYGCNVGPLRKFSKPLNYFVYAIILLEQITNGSVCFIFVAENLKKMTSSELSANIWILILLLPFWATTFIRDLKKMAPVSGISIFLFVLGFCMSTYYLVTDIPSLSDLPMVKPVEQYALFIGVAFYIISPVYLIVVIADNMQKPRDIRGIFGVLSLSMFANCILAILIGFLGYWKYGEAIRSSYTLNFPKSRYTRCIQALTTISVFCFYPLQLHASATMLWGDYLENINKYPQYNLLFEILVRSAIFSVSLIFAIAIPNIGVALTIMGSIFSPLLTCVFPALLNICINWHKKSRRVIHFLRDIFIILIAVFIIGCGTFSSIWQLRNLNPVLLEERMHFII